MERSSFTYFNLIQYLVIGLFSLTLTGCWIFTGEAPEKNNEITGNTLPSKNEEIAQEVNTVARYSFGDITFNGDVVGSKNAEVETPKLLTRRQFFGELEVQISSSSENSQTKKVFWETHIRNEKLFSGQGGFIVTGNSGGGFSAKAIFKNIELANQEDNIVRLYFEDQSRRYLIGAVVIYTDFMPPEIIFESPSIVSFVGGEAASTVWVAQSPATLSGVVRDNAELSGMYYRILPQVQGVEPGPLIPINYTNNRWELTLNIPEEALSIEVMAKDIFENRTIRKFKIGVDDEGPSLVYTNSSGVKQNIEVIQGSQNWEVQNLPTGANPYIIKSLSMDSLSIRGKVLDVASGVKSIKVTSCHTDEDCSDESNWRLLGEEVSSIEQMIERWSFDFNVAEELTTGNELVSGINLVKVISEDYSGNITIAYISIIIDREKPSINSVSFVAENGDVLSNSVSRSVKLRVEASDAQTKIERICLKLDDDFPEASNSCWKNLDAPESNIDLIFDLELGYFPKIYSAYAWVVDEVGNVSDLSVDSQSNIYFTPTNKPEILEILAANTTNLRYWPTYGEMETSFEEHDNSILIKWRVSEEANNLIDHVNISYRVEDGSKEVYSIAQNLFHGINPGCSVSSPFQGCYLWEGDSIPGPNVEFSIRVDIFDENGQGDGANTNNFNNNPYNLNFREYYIFGNVKLGTHHMAQSDVFQTYGYPNYAPNNLIVMPDGTIFIVDYYRGLLRIDANSGITNVIVKTKNGEDDSDNGEDWSIKNSFNQEGYISKIKIHDNHLYMRWSTSDHLAPSPTFFTARAEVINLNTGELANFELNAGDEPDNLWGAEIPDLSHPNDPNCSYVLGGDDNFYCFEKDSKTFYVLQDNTWTKIIEGDGGEGCPDGANDNQCNDLNVTDYFVDQNGTLFFTDRYQIRYLSSSGQIFTIYGAIADDIEKDNGNGIDQKSGRLLRLPRSIAAGIQVDWDNQKFIMETYSGGAISSKVFRAQEVIGTCSPGCDKLSISDEGFSYNLSVNSNGFLGWQKKNENNPPSIPILSLTSDNTPTPGGFQVKKRSVSLGISAEDDNSNIEKVCIKYNVDPVLGVDSNDACWVTLVDHDQLTLNDNNYSFNLGFVAGDYEIYAWVMDDIGNISSNPELDDALKINYSPGKPPEIFSVIATNQNIPDSNPPKYTDLVADSENPNIFIKWLATDFDETTEDLTLDGVKVNLYYSNDNINFRAISNGENLSPSMQASGCSLDSPDEILPDSKSWTGCYRWQVPSLLYEKIIFIRVEVIDSDDLGASALTPPLNAGSLSIIAGDIDKGIGGQARSAMFSMPANSKSDRGGWSFPDSFVVDSRGITYFLDSEIGLLKIDPADGIINLMIGIDNSKAVPALGSDPIELDNAVLRYPVSIYLDHDENLLIFDNKHLRKVRLESNTIETFIGNGGDATIRTFNPDGCPGFASGTNCGFTYSKENFGFQFLTSDSRPQLVANLRTITPLPRGDMLIDFHGFGQGRQSNWNSFFDNNIDITGKVYNDVIYPANRGGYSAESYSGIWWYRPTNFSDPDSDWGFYPIKFSDGARGCRNSGFTVEYSADPAADNWGEIVKIYAILLGDCRVQDGGGQITNSMLEFDPAPLYANPSISSPSNAVVELPWGKLLPTDTPPIFPITAGHTLYHATGVGRNGIPFMYNRANSRAWMIKSVDSDGVELDRSEVGRFMGRFPQNAVGANCLDGLSPMSNDCNMELLDVFVSGDGTIYFWDLSQIKMLTGTTDDYKVKTIFGKPADHGDGYLPTSARFSYISDFGSFGRDGSDNPSHDRYMIMDVYSRKFRSILDGKIDTHFGTGHFGLHRESIVDTSPFQKHRIYFDWGSDNYYQRKSFEIDADGNIYYVNRNSIVNGGWYFENIKVLYDSFYYNSFGQPSVVREMQPITSSFGVGASPKIYYDYKKGDVIDGASHSSGGVLNGTNRIGHLFGINQKDNTLALHMNSKNHLNGGVIYLMDLDTTQSVDYVTSLFPLLSGRAYEFPVVEDVLAYYDDSSYPICQRDGLNLNECIILNLEGHDYGYQHYKDKNGVDRWVSWIANKTIFSMNQVPDDVGPPLSEVFGQFKRIHYASGSGLTLGLDVALINDEEILVYCFSGDLRIINLTTGVQSNHEFIIDGMECTKGGIEIIHNPETNKHSIVTAVSYRGLHALVEIAMPSNPRVTNISIVGDSNSVNDRFVELRFSGDDPNEPLTQYCVKYNDSSKPLKLDSCWRDLDITNSTEITDYLIEAPVGSVAGEYDLFIFLKDKDGEISGVSNDGLGTDGVDVITVIYTPEAHPVINGVIVTTSSSATEMKVDNTRDVTGEGALNRYYISWLLEEVSSEITVDLDVTFNGIDFYPISSGLNAETVGCSNGFTGCYTWSNVSGFISTFIPDYLQNNSFQIRLKLISNDGRVFSRLTGPVRSGSLNIIGENYTGHGSSWEDFSVPIVPQLYDKNIQWNQMMMQQFVVTKRGDILFNHPNEGIIKLDIDTEKVNILIPKRYDEAVGDNGNGQLWRQSKVDNVAKMTIDRSNNVYLIDQNKVRTFNYNNLLSEINDFREISGMDLNNPFNRDLNYAPFFFNSEEKLLQLSPLKLKENTNNFTLNFTTLDHIGELTDFDIPFSDFNEKVFTEYPGGQKEELINLHHNSCGDAGDRIEVDISGCSLINFLPTGRDEVGYTNVIFAAKCACTNVPGSETVGLFHLQPYYDSDNSLLEFDSRIEEAENFARGLSVNHVTDGKFFHGLDGKFYLINRGADVELSSDMNVSPSIDVDSGIWSYSEINGWERLLGQDNQSGTCLEGDAANVCAASPRDMFVTHKGIVYFIENNHIKKINKTGHVEFVTGRAHKESQKTSAGSYQANLFTEMTTFNNALAAVDPLNNIFIQKENSEVSPIYGVIKSSPIGGAYPPLSISSDFACNDTGRICELDSGGGCSLVADEEGGGLIDKIVFPKNTDHIFIEDKEKLLETNRNIYLNDWKCVGSDVYERNSKYYIPYFHRGSGGIMQINLP